MPVNKEVDPPIKIRFTWKPCKDSKIPGETKIANVTKTVDLPKSADTSGLKGLNYVSEYKMSVDEGVGPPQLVKIAMKVRKDQHIPEVSKIDVAGIVDQPILASRLKGLIPVHEYKMSVDEEVSPPQRVKISRKVRKDQQLLKLTETDKVDVSMPVDKQKVKKSQTGKRGDRKKAIKYRTIKLPLKRLLQSDPVLKDEIDLAVMNSNIIVMRATELLRYFIISEFNSNRTITYPFYELCKYALSLVAEIYEEPKVYNKKNAEKNEVIRLQKVALMQFYLKEYKPLMTHPFERNECRGYSLIIEKAGKQIETNYMNNIVAHYVKYLKRYIR